MLNTIRIRPVVLTLTLLLWTSFAFAQRLFIGGLVGLSNYQGDLTNTPFNKHETKAAAGLTATYELTEHWALRGGFTFTRLYGNDKYNTKTYLQARNLNFETAISEFSLVAEYSTFSLDNKRWTPYLFGGVALFHFNPYTWNGHSKLFLKPLSTEGEGLPGYAAKPYALTQPALPFGGGLRYAVNDNVRIGLELGIRKLFTDHLDDISGNYAGQADLLQARGPLAVAFAYRGDEVPNGNAAYPEKGAQRGNALQKDWYFITGLTLSFRLGNSAPTFLGSGKRKGYGCPASPQ